jgi:hypothetical protein
MIAVARIHYPALNNMYPILPSSLTTYSFTRCLCSERASQASIVTSTSPRFHSTPAPPFARHHVPCHPPPHLTTPHLNNTTIIVLTSAPHCSNHVRVHVLNPQPTIYNLQLHPYHPTPRPPCLPPPTPTKTPRATSSPSTACSSLRHPTCARSPRTPPLSTCATRPTPASPRCQRGRNPARRSGSACL